ncbi:MAG: hypothetical protein Q8Q06_04500 [bacterium]|nr:hypothetical protein [bacterium]
MFLYIAIASLMLLAGPVHVSALTFENPIASNDLTELAEVIGKWIFNISIPIGVGVIIYAGILMLTAGGNVARFAQGKKALLYAVIGLAVIFIGNGFIDLVKSILDLRSQ